MGNPRLDRNRVRNLYRQGRTPKEIGEQMAREQNRKVPYQPRSISKVLRELAASGEARRRRGYKW